MTRAAAKRKSHSKSRRGCHPCKQRHIKCNEAHPRCADCTRLDIICTWPAPRSYGSPHNPGPEHHVSMLQEQRNFSSPDLTAHAHTSPPVLAIDDMRLLHHYTAKFATSEDIDSSYSNRMWTVDAVEVAFEHPFLLHGLLACSALHKTLQEPHNDRASLLAQADTHMSSALATYRQLLQCPTSETSLPMFIFFASLIPYNLASAQLEEPANAIDALLHCFRLLRGFRVATGQYWEQLKETSLVIHMLSGASHWQTIPLPAETRFQEILDLKELAVELEPSDKEACIEAIESLHNTFLQSETCLSDKQVHHFFLVWPTRLQDRFLDLVAMHNPVTIIVLVHFAVLMARARHAWWLRGWPERIIDTSYRLLESTPALRRWLDWPAEQMGVSLKDPLADSTR